GASAPARAVGHTRCRLGGGSGDLASDTTAASQERSAAVVSATVLAHRNTGLVRTIVLVLVLLLGATACTATAEAKKRHKHPDINKCRKKKHSDKNEREGPRPDGK